MRAENGANEDRYFRKGNDCAPDGFERLHRRLAG